MAVRESAGVGSTEAAVQLSAADSSWKYDLDTVKVAALSGGVLFDEAFEVKRKAHL